MVNKPILLVVMSMFVAGFACAYAADMPTWPPPIVHPKNNPSTPAKVELGKQLFFDPRLSGNNSMSCATCHAPEHNFGDGRALGKGHAGKALIRNTPTTLNVGLFSKLTWDGRATSLEAQALAPIASPEEMNQNLDELERELNAIPGYAAQFRDVFGTAVTRDGIAKALAAFQRTLVTGPAPYDRFLAGDKNAISEDAKNGMQLFFGEAGCSQCHTGPLLSDEKFYRIGLGFNDRGLGALTGKKEDDYKFRTPSLRNVAKTGPYMHDGSLASLDDVLFFYYRNVPKRSPDGLPIDVPPLVDRSFTEAIHIAAFLQTLTGDVPKVTPPKLPD